MWLGYKLQFHNNCEVAPFLLYSTENVVHMVGMRRLIGNSAVAVLLGSSPSSG